MWRVDVAGVQRYDRCLTNDEVRRAVKPLFPEGFKLLTRDLLRVFLFATFLLALVASLAGAAEHSPILLKPGVPIYLASDAPGPVRVAAEDLARDLEGALGAASAIVAERPAGGEGPYIEVRGLDERAVGDVEGREAHRVTADAERIVLQGADVRGTIYAIYSFSEHCLGVAPLWFWASQPPVPQDSVSLPRDLDLRFGSPDVRWRAWFPNDQDLIGRWKWRSRENFEALYEAMLRLKLNCFEGQIAGGASFRPPYRLDRDVAEAHRRGLAFVGHHIYPLGSSYRSWDRFWREVEGREPPPLSVDDAESLETFWRWHAELGQRNGLEQVWLIGFRGNGDRPFWVDFADAPRNERERAAVIERMMDRQVEIVKEVTGEDAPIMRSTLYNELSDLYAKGLLRPPTEPNLIWTFVAARRDHYPAPDVQDADVPEGQPVGYYLNFQFNSTGAHLAQAEGPWKMERNYRFVDGIADRPLEFSVVNMGNIREFVLEGSANASMMWDFDGYDSDRFLVDFCATYFGRDHAEAVAQLYRDFFDSYWQQRRPDLQGFDRQYLFQDLRLNRAMREILDALRDPGRHPPADVLQDDGPAADDSWFNIRPADVGARTQVDALIAGTAESSEKLRRVIDSAEALLPDLPAQSRRFFVDNLLAQARFLLAANAVTHHLGLALQAEDGERRAASLRAAQQAMRAMRAALGEAEHGAFDRWYDGNRIFDIDGHARKLDELLTPG